MTEAPESDGEAAPTLQARKLAERLAAHHATSKLHALLSHHFSPERIGSFEDHSKADNTPQRIIARYLFSIAAVEALVPAFHVLEVALRNGIYNAVAARITEKKGQAIADCWLDWPEHETLLQNDRTKRVATDYDKVQAAKQDILRRRSLNTGRLIAELSFGFWSGLFASHYGGRSEEMDTKFWPALLPVVFSNLPTGYDRGMVAERLANIRKLRNRAFHHEPLWRRSVKTDLEMISETIGWIDPILAGFARTMSSAKTIQETGFDGYAKRATVFALERFAEKETAPLQHD